MYFDKWKCNDLLEVIYRLNLIFRSAEWAIVGILIAITLLLLDASLGKWIYIFGKLRL